MVRTMTICEAAHRKDSRDIIEEYGYILRWVHHTIETGEKSKIDCVYLEKKDNENDRIYIVDYQENILNKEAYDYIIQKTYNAFRDKTCINTYDNYVKLFTIMKIDRKEKSIEQVKEEIEDGLSI